MNQNPWPLLLLLMPLLSACESLAYYGQAVVGHAGLMSRTKDIRQVLRDPTTPATKADALERVLQIRAFAGDALGLPENGSYRSYTEVEGDAVVYSLVATPEFSLEPLHWCYPVVGCAAYRGYFDLEDARAKAESLKQAGRDVVIQPAAAYSTLGWFDDPLPENLLAWPEARLAELIFHELAHQQLYVPGDSAFNEAFATVVAKAGVARWLQERRSAADLAVWRKRQARQKTFVGLLLETRQRLKNIYAKPLSPAALRLEKAREFERLSREYRDLKAGWGDEGNFDAWFEAPVNNARLASIGTYRLWADSFAGLLCRQRGDLADFYQAAQRLADLPAQQRREKLRELAAGADCGSAE